MRSDDFWNETPYETSCRYIGWCRANGAGPYRADPQSGWSEVEVETFVDEIEELKRRFPDQPKRERAKVDA